MKHPSPQGTSHLGKPVLSTDIQSIPQRSISPRRGPALSTEKQLSPQRSNSLYRKPALCTDLSQTTTFLHTEPAVWEEFELNNPHDPWVRSGKGASLRPPFPTGFGLRLTISLRPLPDQNQRWAHHWPGTTTVSHTPMDPDRTISGGQRPTIPDGG